jgi:hypothetical protein
MHMTNFFRSETAMSKPNKANKNNYSQAGRLTADDLAREQQKQRLVTASGGETLNQGGKGKGSKPDAPRGRNETSGRRSTGAKKSRNRPGPSGTGPKKPTKGSSSRRRSGSRSGGKGTKGKMTG